MTRPPPRRPSSTSTSSSSAGVGIRSTSTSTSGSRKRRRSANTSRPAVGGFDINPLVNTTINATTRPSTNSSTTTTTPPRPRPSTTDNNVLTPQNHNAGSGRGMVTGTKNNTDDSGDEDVMYISSGSETE